ncbi:MAG TPA: type 1 glutamine amidotransferase domain-containing protein [Tepidisphaeraceae bacterium]|nr:type 1 glutamine amidotransferase domain-containing protein [Tepidisphaeraceae bacterium]
MRTDLLGKRIAVLVDNGFEQVEMTGPRDALREANARIDIISPQLSQVRSWQHNRWGDSFNVDIQLGDADPELYDGLVLPGGVMNPDHLRQNPDAKRFVKAFVDAGKPIAAICHGPWTLIEVGAVNGRTMTSYPSIQTDLKNAGANWVDQEVVVDNGIVTSRSPKDLPAFNRKMIEEFAGGKHARRAMAPQEAQQANVSP